MTRWAVVAAVAASPWWWQAAQDAWTEQPSAGMRLRVAAMAGEMGAVNDELADGADVNEADSQGDTALICAAVGGSMAVVDRLLATGAVVDLADKWGETPLMHAARSDRAEVVRVLLGRGASMSHRNCNGLTAKDLARLAGAGNSLAVLLAAEAAGAEPVASVPVGQ